MVRRARRPMFRIDVSRPIEATQFLEDERIVDLAGARLEPSGVIAYLDDLDQLVLEAVAEADHEIPLGPLQMVQVEADLDVRMVDFLDHGKGFKAAVERAARLIGIDAQRFESDGHAGGGRDVASALQPLDDLRALRLPRHVRLDDADEADEIRFGPKFFGNLDALLDFREESVLRTGFGEAGRPAGGAGAHQADALEAGFLLRLDHRLALVGHRIPEAVCGESLCRYRADPIGARHRRIAASGV